MVAISVDDRAVGPDDLAWVVRAHELRGIDEVGPVGDVINRPAHPYTIGLMGSIPAMDENRERLTQIDGAMPRLNAIPRGCAFNPRCPRVFDRCKAERPDLMDAGATRAACWLVGKA